jgi:hypothetical protein
MKRRSTSTWLQGTTSHKTSNFIFAEVSTLNLTISNFISDFQNSNTDIPVLYGTTLLKIIKIFETN